MLIFYSTVYASTCISMFYHAHIHSGLFFWVSVKFVHVSLLNVTHMFGCDFYIRDCSQKKWGKQGVRLSNHKINAYLIHPTSVHLPHNHPSNVSASPPPPSHMPLPPSLPPLPVNVPIYAQGITPSKSMFSFALFHTCRSLWEVLEQE